MASKLSDAQYRSIVLDLRPEDLIAKEFSCTKEYIRKIKTGRALLDYRQRLDEYHLAALDWQFRLELFVKARQKQNKTKATEEFAELFTKENPFPRRADYE